MLKLPAFALAAAALAGLGAPAARAQPFEEGVHYVRLARPQATSTAPDRIEVAEVFLYDCVWCYRLEPHLQRWAATMPEHIELVRVPVALNERQQRYARAYYTAQLLDELERVHAAFFEEIHERGNALAAEGDIAALFARFGVDSGTFRDVFDSFAVAARTARAGALVRGYGVGTTPAVVVHGKYLTQRSMVSSYEEWFSVIEHLAAAEHAAGAAAQ